MLDPHPDIQAKLAMLRVSYAEQLPHKYAQIAEAWTCLQSKPAEREALTLMHRLAHSLTGSGATFGFDEISAAARHLERQLKQVLAADTESAPNLLVSAGIAMQVLQKTMLRANNAALPSATMQPIPLSPSMALHPGGERVIFIVEDDAHISKEIALQLQQHGYKSRVFSRIAGVREAILKSAPAALIVDIHLPDGNSAEAFSATHLAETWQVPLIFVSAKMDFASRLQAVRAGGNAYFAKPLDIGQIIDRLDELTNVVPAEEYRILVVDDSEPVAKYHASLLEQAGMQAMVCTDPTVIMQPLVDWKPDLILLDVYMPVCSGFEIAAVLRQQDYYLGMPIVFLSSETDVSQQLVALDLGADDYLTKPIDPQRLISIVSARVQRARLMRAFISHDSLTGLLNHTSTKDALAREIALSLRQKTPLSFVIIDMDGFKSVNDTFGHQAGDRVLKSLARLLQLHLRKTDYAGRYGGEEFAMILPHTDGAAAQVVLDKLRCAFGALVQHAGAQSFSCTFSGGIAEYGHDQTLAGLINAADKALYAAKNGGRDRIVLAN